MRVWFVAFSLLACVSSVGFCQNASSDRVTPRARSRLSHRFRRANVAFPPRRVHVRVFKAERHLELWASGRRRGRLQLIHRYAVCRMSGHAGPKSRQGDRQVPEGFYRVSVFNPRSRHVVSLGLNYPNRADRTRIGRRRRLGGDIFIHGGCSSAGCVAVGDAATQEIYFAALGARERGQQAVTVNIYPRRMRGRGLRRLYRRHPRHRAFWESLRRGYRYFERTRLPPEMGVDADGLYVLNDQS